MIVYIRGGGGGFLFIKLGLLTNPLKHTWRIKKGLHCIIIVFSNQKGLLCLLKQTGLYFTALSLTTYVDNLKVVQQS